MKRLIAVFILFTIILFPAGVFGAGTCEDTPVAITKGQPAGIVTVKFTCRGDAAAGTVPNTSVPTQYIQYLTKAKPYYLNLVRAYPTGLGTSSFVFVDGDVSVANDTITETAHGYSALDPIRMTTTGTLPGGLALATTYYVIVVDANTIALGSSVANATADSRVDITSAAGGGNHTFDATRPDAADVFVLDDKGMDLLGSIDNGTTAYAGLNLLQANKAAVTTPDIFLIRGGTHETYFPRITGALTLKQANQGTAAANWFVELVFVEDNK